MSAVVSLARAVARHPVLSGIAAVVAASLLTLRAARRRARPRVLPARERQGGSRDAADR